jgi:membrane protease YdiL (CAAX protease family)
VIGASVAVVGMKARPAPWQVGLRRAPFGFCVGMAFIAAVAVVLFTILYSSVVDTENKQQIVDELGADRSTLLLVVGALVVIVVAPACEEIFFRGFLFRVLRQRMGFWLAAAVDGVIFGAVHLSPAIIPILAVLGIALCWVYERTGSVFPCIAIHALNNTIAYGSLADNGWAAAGIVGAGMLAACVVVPTVLPRGAPARA